MMLPGFRQFRWNDPAGHPLVHRALEKFDEMDRYLDSRETNEAFGVAASSVDFLFDENRFARVVIDYVLLAPEQLDRLVLALTDLWGEPKEEKERSLKSVGWAWRTWVSADRKTSAFLRWSDASELANRGKLTVDLTIQSTERMVAKQGKSSSDVKDR